MSAAKGPMPVPSEFSFEHEGESLEFSKYLSKTSARVTGIVIDRFRFASCPICLEREPDTAEHVPPASLGGKIMTMTCSRCNNDLATAEEQLRAFIDLETTVEAKAPDGPVRGRRSARVALRSSQGRPPGAFVRSAAPQFDDVLGSPSGHLTLKPLDMPLVLAAGLKHAYLAAFLHQQVVPVSADVDRVRAVLLAARDRDRQALSAALTNLGFEAAFGWIEAPNIPPVMLLETKEADTRWVLLFGGRFILQWPFADVEPRAAAV